MLRTALKVALRSCGCCYTANCTASLLSVHVLCVCVCACVRVCVCVCVCVCMCVLQVKSGHSNATVHCTTKNGERFIKHIQHVDHHVQLWNVISGLLQKLQCCENFIRPRGSSGRCPLCIGNITDAPMAGTDACSFNAALYY